MSQGFTIDFTPTESVEHAKAGDPGFEWGANFTEGGGGLTFAKFAGFVFCTGYAYYTGAFQIGSMICSLPEGWRDNIGAEAVVSIAGHVDQPVTIYASPNGLKIGDEKSPPDDSYVSIQAFWPAA